MSENNIKIYFNEEEIKMIIHAARLQLDDYDIALCDNPDDEFYKKSVDILYDIIKKLKKAKR